MYKNGPTAMQLVQFLCDSFWCYFGIIPLFQ